MVAMAGTEGRMIFLAIMMEDGCRVFEKNFKNIEEALWFCEMLWHLLVTRNLINIDNKLCER